MSEVYHVVIRISPSQIGLSPKAGQEGDGALCTPLRLINAVVRWSVWMDFQAPHHVLCVSAGCLSVNHVEVVSPASPAYKKLVQTEPRDTNRQLEGRANRTDPGPRRSIGRGATCSLLRQALWIDKQMVVNHYSVPLS